MNIRQIFKSKTVDFNILVPVVVKLAAVFGWVIPVDVVTSILVIGNILLRFLTKKSISDK